jgi:hypothetical protein
MVKIYSIQFLIKNSPSLSSCRVLFYTERNSEWFSLPRNGSERNSESLLLLLLQLFIRAKGAPTFLGIFFMYIIVLRNGIPSYFLFQGRVRNGIPRVCFYFCSKERNSELFSLPRKGSERNSVSFCSAEQPEFRRK